MSDQALEQLEELFRAVFDLPAGVDVTKLTQPSTEAWDSLGHVSLVTAMESEFDVEISAADSIEINSFDAAVMILTEVLEG